MRVVRDTDARWFARGLSTGALRAVGYRHASRVAKFRQAVAPQPTRSVDSLRTEGSPIARSASGAVDSPCALRIDSTHCVLQLRVPRQHVLDRDTDCGHAAEH